MNPQEEVGAARIRENEKIADALRSSILAGNLLYAPSDVRDKIIEDYKKRLQTAQPAQAAQPAATAAQG